MVSGCGNEQATPTLVQMDDGTYKSFALAEVTNVERDNTGHLVGYTYKIIKDMKVVKSDVTEHFEVNE